MNYMWKAVAAAVLVCSIFSIGCGDTFRQIATPISPPAGDPSASGTIGVIESSGTALHGFTQQIDAAGDVNVGEKPIGAGVSMGVIDPSGASIFTPDTDSNTVTAVSLAAFAQVTIGLHAPTGSGAGPTYVGSTKVGTMFVTVAGATDACTSGAGYLGVIDTTTLSLINAICLENGAGKLTNPNFLVQSADTQKIYVLDSTTNQMAIIDTASGAIDKIVTVGSAPSFAVLSIDQKFVFVLNKNSDNISVFQVADQTVVGAVATGGTGAQFMTTDARLNRLYVANTGSGTVSAFDISQPLTPKLLGSPIIGGNPIALAVLGDGSRIYVANGANAVVTELLASNLSFIRNITVNPATGATATSITSSADSTKVFVGTKDPTSTANGVISIRTSDDTLGPMISSPKIDSTCPSTTVPAPCILYDPVYVFTKR